LREGSYIFEATIHEENAAFVAAPLRFKLTVLPPWFRTTWAYFLFAFIALLLFYLGRWLAKNWRFLISPRTKFIGKFKLIKILGTGNMSKVYEAYDPDRKKAVAIKLVENDENTADDIFRMFIKEAEIGKELEHENIVRIFDAGTANNARYLTMEKIEGITLKTAINENLIKTDTERFAIAAKLLRALAYLHEKGIVHRDLKSSNVMVNLKTGDLKLMDFGLSSARQLVSLADRSAIVGTLGYMSPEQTIGKGVSQQSDIYSFGVILYELFFNELPFLAANEMELIFAIHNETPTQFILSKKPIINLIKTCMARDVAARFANANKILRLLEDLKNEIAITI
jgi:serine/threonine-protein kinase